VKGEALFEYEKYPEDKTEKDLERHVASAIRGHMKNLLDCMASRGRPVADVEEGYTSTASCILANLSAKLGRSLTWDPAKGQIVGDDEANKLLLRPYRAPWKHPAA
ncbi:MAG: gfo/Idh/MocA family oxidoreductase, partial [Tepidisphaeraceae bacterium]